MVSPVGHLSCKNSQLSAAHILPHHGASVQIYVSGLVLTFSRPTIHLNLDGPDPWGKKEITPTHSSSHKGSCLFH